MTLTIAWVRQCDGHQELVLASDSRLSSSGHVDICQKVFPLPREDCAIAFCGDTALAYPFILQLIASIGNNKKKMDRAFDMKGMPAFVCSVINNFISHHKDYLDDIMIQDLKGTSFIFGGWSWKNGEFVLKSIKYENKLKKYHPITIGVWKSFGLPRNEAMPVAFIGDYEANFLMGLKEKLKETGGIERRTLDQEPLQVLYEMLNNKEYTDRSHSNRGRIGGMPQLVKVYPFMRSVKFGVKTPDGRLFDMGRPVSRHESFSGPIIDLQTFKSYLPKPSTTSSQTDAND